MSLHPAQFLPNGGLNHSMDELIRMDHVIHTLPLEQQSNYADQWCQKMAKDEEFALSQLVGLDEEKNYSLWNSTSVGNCAYMVLHAPTDDLRQKYAEGLSRYCTWKNNQSDAMGCVVV